MWTANALDSLTRAVTWMVLFLVFGPLAGTLLASAAALAFAILSSRHDLFIVSVSLLVTLPATVIPAAMAGFLLGLLDSRMLRGARLSLAAATCGAVGYGAFAGAVASVIGTHGLVHVGLAALFGATTACGTVWLLVHALKLVPDDPELR